MSNKIKLPTQFGKGKRKKRNVKPITNDTKGEKREIYPAHY